MSKITETMNIIRSIRQQTDTAVLFYSAGGKDGIALLDMLAKTFPKVICYYMYLIPNLDHIRPYILWAKTKYKNVEVRQIPHFQKDTFDKLGLFSFREPNPDLKCRTIGDIEEQVRQETVIQYAFSGMKGVDGYMKRMRLKMWKNTNYTSPKGMVYPLAVWTNKEVLAYIKQQNLIAPFEYEKAISQGFGIDLSTLLKMRQSFPNDLKRILQEYPMAEKILFDYDNNRNTTANTKYDEREQG